MWSTASEPGLRQGNRIIIVYSSFSKTPFSNFFRPISNFVSNSSSLKNISVKLRYRGRLVWTVGLIVEKRCVFKFLQLSVDGALRGEKLNYNSCTNLLLRKSQNLLFWLLKSSGHKVYRVCSIHVFFKCFEPRPYLVCHVTTIENV